MIHFELIKSFTDLGNVLTRLLLSYFIISLLDWSLVEGLNVAVTKHTFIHDLVLKTTLVIAEWVQVLPR